MSESFAELFEESLSYTQMKPGSLVNASVIDVRSDFIIVSAGLKSEGVIPAEQFKNEKGEVTVQVGDLVEVALDTVEDGFGETTGGEMTGGVYWPNAGYVTDPALSAQNLADAAKQHGAAQE